MTRASHTLFSLFLSALLVLAPRPARADLLGADVPLLVELVANSFAELESLRQSLATARATYDETKELASYAHDAASAYRSFKDSGGHLFDANVTAALETAFPDLAYLRAEAQQPGPWGAGRGQLQRLVRLCLTTKGQCREVEQAMSLAQTREAISATFGTVPDEDVRGRLAREHVAVALTAASGQAGRSIASRQRAEELMAQCTRGVSIEACQAAAAAADIAQLQQGADIADQLAQNTTLQALEVADRDAERQRVAREDAARQELLHHAADAYAPRVQSVKTDGINLFGDFAKEAR